MRDGLSSTHILSVNELLTNSNRPIGLIVGEINMKTFFNLSLAWCFFWAIFNAVRLCLGTEDVGYDWFSLILQSGAFMLVVWTRKTI